MMGSQSHPTPREPCSEELIFLVQRKPFGIMKSLKGVWAGGRSEALETWLRG